MVLAGLFTFTIPTAANAPVHTGISELPTATVSSHAARYVAKAPFAGAVASSLPASVSMIRTYQPSGHAPSSAQLARLNALGVANQTASPSSNSTLSFTSIGAPILGAATPRPLANATYATATGTVESAVTQSNPTSSPISGVAVSVSPIGGACPTNGCPPTQTSSSGGFTVKILAGTGDQLNFQAGWYLDNYSVITNVSVGAMINVGVVYLVPEGVVTGIVQGNDSSHEAIPQVEVTGSTRDGKLLSIPSTSTNSKGVFSVPVPQGPAEVQFSPVAGWSLYFGTLIYVDVTPGTTLNVGVVRLPVGTAVVTSTVKDLSTHQPVPGGNCGFGVCWAMKICSRAIAGYCYPEGPSVDRGSMMSAVAPAGNDTITIMAAGYVANVTDIYVPQYAPGHVYRLPMMYLIPDTPVALDIGLTWYSAAKNAIATWGTGFVDMSTCSLDGYTFSSAVTNIYGATNMTSPTSCNSDGSCTPLYAADYAAAAPLRNSIHMFPDTTANCAPAPTWPIPGALPVSDNWTWVNATMGRVTVVGEVDLTPGTYISGSVTPAGTVQVIGCSTDEVTACPQGTGTTDNVNYTVAGCPASPSEFCVPVLPGPSELKFTASVYPVVSNYAWVYDPPGLWQFLPLPLSKASTDGVGTIHMIVGGTVTGLARDALTGLPPSGFPTVAVKPAGQQATPGVNGAVTQQTGAFTLPAPPGWDVVSVTAPNYVTNFTWVYVSSGVSSNVGVINLTPLAFIQGNVFGSNGVPINTTSVQICPVSSVGCTTILSPGQGEANSNGTYVAQVTSGHLPLGGYRIFAEAPGYLSNQTWVNVTRPGSLVYANTLYLYPFLGAPKAMGPRAHSAVAPTATWVYGRVIDNATGQGLQSASILLTPTDGGNPSQVQGLTPEGFFNFSQPLGQYWMNVTLINWYYPVTLFLTLNLTSVPSYNVGTIGLEPLHWIAGRVVIDPWRNTVTLGPGVGPIASVQACNHNRTMCGAIEDTDTGGYFNVSAPYGIGDRISVIGTGKGTGSVAAGFLSNYTFWNVTPTPPPQPLIIGIIAFSVFAGYVTDSSTNNQTPVRWGTVELRTFTTAYGPSTVTETLTGGGSYIVIAQPGNVTIGAAIGSAYEPAVFNYTYPYDLSDLTNITPGQVTWMPNVSLVHYGYLQFLVNSTVPAFGNSSTAVPGATTSASVIDQHGNQYSSAPTLAASDGFVNMSAPPGMNVSIIIGAPDYNTTMITNISINSSETTFIGKSVQEPLSFTNVGNVSIVPWAWVGGVIWDPAVNQGIGGAAVVLTDSTGELNEPGIVSNAIGVFFSDSPVGKNVSLAITATGYIANNTVVPTHPGNETNLSRVDMVGYGIVAGRVFGYPGLRPEYQAYVSVCPQSVPQCQNSNATTNGTGYFWVTAQPGRDVVNITLPGYSFNLSSEVINVKADTWYWAGDFVLNEYATVTGIVLGNPSGLPVVDANVSMCSSVVIASIGPVCFTTVLTDLNGHFSISVPAGDYLLSINATGYNTSYIPVFLLPGEYVPLGTIFLQQFGTIAGVVLGADTNAPISGSLVEACPLWVAGNCTALEPTSPSGRFRVSGPPGGYLVLAKAPGYQDLYVSAPMVAGQVTTLPPIFLTPVGTSALYTLSGTVIGGSNQTPLAGAVVSAGAAYATATTAGGGYTLKVPWGTYLLTAQANGYVAGSQVVEVHSDLSGLNFLLAQATFALSGSTLDGLTGNPIPGVQIYGNGQLLTVSDDLGNYAVQLVNGSYTFQAVPPANLGSAYTSVSFHEVLAGTPIVRNIALYPPVSQVYGVVVNVITGAPLVNATVVLQGTSQEGVSVKNTFTTDALGSFAVSLYPGTYTVNATSLGYQSTQTPFSASSGTPQTLTLRMTPVSGSSTTSNGGVGLAPLLVVGAVVIVGLVVYLNMGRPRTGVRAGSHPPKGSSSGAGKS
jgi:hypothetical protein